jgi:hypothetical protein
MKMQFILIALLILIVFVCPVSAEEDKIPPSLTVNIVPNENGTVRIYGTASDVSGIDRVEVKVDDSSWRTADLSGTEFTLMENITATGTHVAQIRAFDTVGNPSVIETKTFFAQKKLTAGTGDLSFFIRLSSLKVATFNTSTNQREMAYPQDFRVEFTINNEDSEPHKIRYRIDVNGEELTEDTNIRAGGKFDVGEWYQASLLSEGQNRIRVTLIDWETREVIEDKNLTINLLSTAIPEKNLTENTPEWLKAFAEANGLIIPETAGTYNNQSNRQLEIEISQLKREIEQLKAVSNVSASVPEKTIFEKYWMVGVLALAVVCFYYLHQSGKLDELKKKRDSKNPDEQDEKTLEIQ